VIPLVCPAVPLIVSLGSVLVGVGSRGGWWGRGLGPIAAAMRVSRAIWRGGAGRRGGRVGPGGRRAGTAMMRRRRVAPRARAWWPPAGVLSARSRLWAIAAHSAQAELTPKCPDGRWASGPSIRSANTVCPDRAATSAWWALGDLHGARTQLERALQISEATLGPSHPQTDAARSALQQLPPGAAEPSA
jgi:hypothetical protein